MAITFPRIIPNALRLRKSRMGIAALVDVAESPLNRAVQTLSRPGDQWQGLFTTPPLAGADRQAMKAWLTSLQGPVGSFHAFDPDQMNPTTGVFDGGEAGAILANSNNLDLSPWTTFNLTVSASSLNGPTGTAAHDLKPDTSNNVHQLRVQQVRLWPGRTYTFSGYFQDNGWKHVSIFPFAVNAEGDETGTQPVVFDVAAGTIVSGANASISSAANGNFRCEVFFTIPDETEHVVFRINVLDDAQNFTFAGDGVKAIAADFCQIDEGKVAGPILTPGDQVEVDGASQTGKSIATRFWQPSTLVLVPGDPFEVNGEYKIATRRITSDGAGLATLEFEPPLRASPADGEPLYLYAPRLKARLDSLDTSFWESDFNKIPSFSWSWVEDFR